MNKSNSKKKDLDKLASNNKFTLKAWFYEALQYLLFLLILGGTLWVILK